MERMKREYEVLQKQKQNYEMIIETIEEYIMENGQKRLKDSYLVMNYKRKLEGVKYQMEQKKDKIEEVKRNKIIQKEIEKEVEQGVYEQTIR